MKHKKIFLLICLVICVFSMASVCASEANDTAMASEDTGLELSADNEMDVDNLETNEETPATEDNGDTEKPAPKKGSNMIFPIILLVIAASLLGGAIIITMNNRDKSKTPKDNPYGNEEKPEVSEDPAEKKDQV